MRQKISPGPGQPEREAELVEVTKFTEGWNEYVLADGTILRARQLVLEVWRLLDAWDVEGNPQYVIKGMPVFHATAPERLKKEVQQ